MTDDLSIWTVYDHPTDYPADYVARRCVARAGEIEVTHDLLRYQNIDKLRLELMKRGLTRLSRNPLDDPKIMEVWL